MTRAVFDHKIFLHLPSALSAGVVTAPRNDQRDVCDESFWRPTLGGTRLL